MLFKYGGNKYTVMRCAVCPSGPPYKHYYNMLYTRNRSAIICCFVGLYVGLLCHTRTPFVSSGVNIIYV